MRQSEIKERLKNIAAHRNLESFREIKEGIDIEKFGATLHDSFRNKNTIHAVTIRENATILKTCFFGHDLLVGYFTDAKVRVVLAHNIEQDVLVLNEETARYQAIAGCLEKELFAVADEDSLSIYDFTHAPEDMVVARIDLEEVRDIDFTEDGTKLVAAVGAGVKVFSAASNWGETSASKDLGGGDIHNVQFDHANEHFVAACSDGTVRKVQATVMSVVKEFKARGAKSAYVSSQGKYLAVACADGAAVYDYGTGGHLQTLSDGGSTNHVSINRGERFVMASLSTSRVTVWDIESNF